MKLAPPLNLYYNYNIKGLNRRKRRKKYENLVVWLAGRGGGEEEVSEVVCDCWERRRGPRNGY